MTVSSKINFDDVKKRFTKIEKGTANLKEPLTDIGDDLVDFFEENIESEGKDLGVRWAALAPSTLQARARGYGHYGRAAVVRTKMLQWTGELKKSFRKKVESNKVTIDNTADYFKYNLNRPMLGINAKVKAIVLFNLEKYISKLIK